MSHASHDHDELAAAKAAVEKLQASAAGTKPIAIPGSIDDGPTPVLEPPRAPHPDLPPVPSTDDDRDDQRLEGGGHT